MKVIRVIANCPGEDEDEFSDISEHIGYEYNVVEELGDGTIYVDFKYDIFVLYPGEYEVVE